MKKYIVLTLATVLALSASSCDEKDKSNNDKDSISVSAYIDSAQKNSSQFAESRTLEEELYMRYTEENIANNKESIRENVFAKFYDDLTDTDGDGLIDLAENDAKTDVENPDTDGDGVDDFCEIYLLGTNPTEAD